MPPVPRPHASGPPRPGRNPLRGVFYGWWIVFSSWVLFMLAGGILFYGFTAFFRPIAEEFGWSYAVTSLAFSLRSLEGGVLQPLMGYFIDRFGPRRMILFGVTITSLGLILLSRISSLTAFYAVFLFMAVGSTAGFGNAQYAAVANWFRRRRALAMGVLSLGFVFSGLLPPLLVVLISRTGWRTAALICALVMLGVGLPLALVVRHSPEPYGYLPDGEQLADGFDPRTLEEEEDEGVGTREALRTRFFWLLTGLSLATGFAQSAMGVHIIPYLTSEQVGMSAGAAGLVITGYLATSTIGRLGFAFLGDYYDKTRLIALAAGLQTVGLFLFALAGTPWAIPLFIITYGPGYSAPIPLAPALQAERFGVRTFATLRGLIGMGWPISGLIAPPLAGLIYDLRGDYRLAWLLFATLSAAAIPMALMLRGAVSPPRRSEPAR